MANHPESPEPDNSYVEYSGPYEGDERDPKLLKEIIPGVADEIRRNEAHSDLLAARARVIRLGNDRLEGRVTEGEYAEAVDELNRLEEKYRKLPHPEE